MTSDERLGPEIFGGYKQDALSVLFPGPPPALFKFGDFKLHSGEQSNWKIECDALTNEDWMTLARISLPRVEPFNRVLDCGGASMKFAAALRPFQSKNHGTPLIVDDVWTTGKTMEAVRANVLNLPPGQVKGLVVFARRPVHKWVQAIFMANLGV